MKKFRVFLIIALLLSACNNANPSATPKPERNQLPTPGVTTVSVPDVTVTVNDFLSKWNGSDYMGMYDMLAQTSKDAITADDFSKLYSDTAINLTLKELKTSIVSTLVTPTSAKVGYKVNFDTNLFGEIERTMEMNLVMDSGTWKIQWAENMILPELSGGNRLILNVEPPSRGDINDKNGETLVTQTNAVAIGFIPSLLSSTAYPNLVALLSELLDKPKNIIEDTYNESSAEWYIPVGEASQGGYEEYENALNSFTGLVINPYSSRYYFNGGVAPQVLGYMLSISPEQYDEYRRLGYAGDEKIGVAGLEKSQESYLAGSPAADLYVVKPDGTYDTRLASRDPQPSNNVNTTLDKDFQILVQKALMGFTGAVVVMEVDTGKILAMASSPGFDPNVFQTDNYNSQYLLGDVVNDQTTPLWNRATQSSYPLGSVFKLVTAAAALESGLYKTNTTYECGYEFTELPNFVGEDWTKAKGLEPSGTLTLLEGIMRSCNPWFYHLGLDLYRQKGPTYLSNMARGFGLGEATGIDVLAEDDGEINDPTTEGAAVQMGIGQGDMLVTPIQVVDFIAAIGNGGTLYRPQIIESITTVDGEVIQSFTPEVRGTLPVSQETLAALKEGMGMVVQNERGTAYRVLGSLDTPIYGKTGTATTSVEDPHSWFAGFTDSNDPEKPDIAIAVVAENAGDGSVYAARVFKRIIQDYYLGAPVDYYPWEKDYYRTVTPTIGTEPTTNP